MSPVEANENNLSEAGRGEGDNLKLVPVVESIRYRKRAQNAEKKVEALAEQLAQAEARACEMAARLEAIHVEGDLTRRLAAAGVVDVETAVLIAKTKVEGKTEAEIDGVIEQLKREKQYLFSEPFTSAAPKKTAGAKDRIQRDQTILEKAAKKAATTGSRTDLQEYLKMRRNFV
ncbi:MAG: hypothetical protein ACYSP9_04815 [Planctomycetota bacterium]|jgi:uncharacterized protein YhaN